MNIKVEICLQNQSLMWWINPVLIEIFMGFTIFKHPLNALCDNSKCYSKIKNRFLYADDDHFSKFGAIYIANYFQNEIFN